MSFQEKKQECSKPAGGEPAAEEEFRCPKCWSYMDETDNFCRNCGAQSAHKKFSAEANMMNIIYGPPDFEEPWDGWGDPPSGFDPKDNVMEEVYGSPPNR